MAKTLSSNTFTIRCFNPTRDLYGYIECCFAQNTLSETTIRNLHQDLKKVLFAHLEQEDFLLGRVTF